MIFKDSIQGGRVELFSTDDGWSLHEGFGDRSHWRRILFDMPFMHSPFVVTALSGVDASKDTNLRIVVHAHSVTQFGFDLEVRTWADSIINFAAINWTAYEIVN